jgi:ATP-dependent helicase HrpB
LDPLPIDAYLSDIAGALRQSRALVLVAEPGAGKTTRVPPSLLDAGPLLLLQPRRAAARAIAHRIALERSWTVGREIGWQVRFERRFTAATRLLVATEGILTARLQQDPLLSGFATVVLDEFHERSIHTDLGLALAREAWRARPDLRLLVMSATIDAQPISDFLYRCPIVRVPGRTHPLDIAYAPSMPVADAAAALLARSPGDVLCFLPGAREIQRTIAALGGRVSGADIVPLYGSLPAHEQDRALSASSTDPRRIVVATNIAETSVTVPRVTAVVDSGLQKVARYDPSRAIDSLTTERITADAAEQRAGRAGRTAPGQVLRLWHARDRLIPHRQPEIARIDLCGTVLDIVAWGGDPARLEWFETPPAESLEAARILLERLGALEAGALTSIGRQMRSVPLHPRLARILVAGGGTRIAARACAVLSEPLLLPPRAASTLSDVLSALDEWPNLPPHVHHAAREFERMAARFGGDHPLALTDEGLRRALLAGYPDRVAQRREARSARVKLASGTGAVLGRESGVREGEWLVALDVQASNRADDPDGLIRIASVIERSWIAPTNQVVVHRLDDAGTVRAARIERYGALTLSETPVAVDESIATPMLAAAWLERKLPDPDQRLIRRLAFAGCEIDLPALVERAAAGCRALSEIDLERALPRETAVQLAKNAPETLNVPSGRSLKLEYGEDGSVSLSVKLQELFGLAETPRLGPKREAVLLALLAPNGRPVQMTRDLRSFWERTYPEVRKELKGRYPKHPWPEDPWNAPPTARTKRRS